MSTAETFALLEAAQSGDEEAGERVLRENTGLIWSVVRRYNGRGVETEDLYQLGCIGFLKAVKGFDLTYGTQFSTYAVPKIAGEIRRFLRDDGAIKVSRTLRERSQSIYSAREKLRDLTKGFTQTASTEATASNYDAARIAILKDYHSAVKAAKSDALVIFEHFCEKKEEQELAAEGIYLWRNMNNAYCQSAMGWKENSGFDGLYESTPSWVGFMESHDEERMGYKQTQWGNGVLQTDLPTRIRQLAANAAFFFTVPGPKMIWQFGELGYDFSINSNETGTAVSEEYRTSRKPIRWDYYENATRKELFEIYSQLIDLRNEKPSLFEGNATLTWRAGASDWDQGRSLYLSGITGEAIAVVGNFSNTDADVTFPGPIGEWRNYFTGQNETVTEKVTVPANHFILYTRF